MLEQYGSSVVAVLIVGRGACDWKSCWWNTEIIWLREETVERGRMGISRLKETRLGGISGCLV